MDEDVRSCRDVSGFVLLLILVSNLGAAKCIALCEAMELCKKYYKTSKFSWSRITNNRLAM